MISLYISNRVLFVFYKDVHVGNNMSVCLVVIKFNIFIDNILIQIYNSLTLALYCLNYGHGMLSKCIHVESGPRFIKVCD